MDSVVAPPNFASKLAGQTVLLVGGTGGVGIGVAHALLQSEASVVITGSREIKLASTLKQLKGQYSDLQNRISGHVCDLASAQVEGNAIDCRQSTLPTIDLAEITATSVAKVSQVRVTGALLVIKHRISHLESSPASSIVMTTGSIASKPISGGWSLLSFVCAGLSGLTRQLAFDLAPIRVNCVAPGTIATDLWDPMGEQAKKDFFENETSRKRTGRMGQAEDVAEAYTYLMRDLNITSIMIDTNGGSFLT